MLLLRLIGESFIFAINSLILNKLRAFLSLLGITIGIFAIIAVFTVLDSIEANIKDTIASLGDNVVYVGKWPWEFEGEYKWWKYLNRPVPELQELDEILHSTSNVEAGAFMVSSSKTVKFENNSIDGIILLAASHDYEKIQSYELEKGRYFSTFESKNGKNIAIIGHTIATSLLRNRNPLGKTINIMGKKIKVVGVFAKEGQDLITNMSDDNTIFIPINFARNFMDIRSENNEPMIMLKAKKGISALELSEELHGTMRAIRKLKPKAEDNFALNRTSLLTKGFDSLFSTVKIVSAIIGGFSILVGAFGIANIMFVSVKERTHQIGIQKSLGAKNYFILFQFLFESVLLCLIGGVAGLALIYIGTIYGSEYINMKLYLTFVNILRGICISVGSGIIAGIIPAWMASRLNPVVAMSTG